MSDSTIILDFLIESKFYNNSIRSKLNNIFDYVIVSQPDTCTPNISIVPVDCGPIGGSAVMEDMPLRITLAASDNIKVLCQKIHTLLSFGISMTPLSVRIDGDHLRLSSKISFVSHNTIMMEVHGNEEKRTAVEAYDSIISVLASEISDGVRIVASQDGDNTIVVASGDLNEVLRIFEFISGSIGLNINQKNIVHSSTALDECTISVISTAANAVIGYFRTIDDIKEYTIANAGGFSLSELFFREVG